MMMNDKKLDLLALASIPLVMTLGNSMLIPILPLLEQELSISSFQSSMVITVYSIIAIILIPFAGYLSDKLGRKKIIIPSLIITAIGGGLSGFAAWKLSSPYLLILIGRFLQGIGAAGAFPVVIPTVGDMFEQEEEISAGLGLIETANTFGKVLSPVIGAALALLIWYAPFLFIPVISLIAILLVAFLVKSPIEKKEQKTTFKLFFANIKTLFKKKGRWLISIFLVGCLNMFVLFGVLFHFSSLLESDFEMKGVMKGLILAIPLLCLCIASFVTGKKIGSNKVLMKWLIVFSNLLAGMPLIFVKDEIGIVWFLIILSLSGIGIGVSLPCLDALITEGIEKNVRGTVTSLYSSMRFLGVAAGPPIIALIMDHVHGMYITLAILSGIGAAIALLLIKPKQQSKPVNMVL